MFYTFSTAAQYLKRLFLFPFNPLRVSVALDSENKRQVHSAGARARDIRKNAHFTVIENYERKSFIY